MQPKPRANYLDANAGAHPHREVIETLQRLLQDPAALGSNPSSIHAYGRKAKAYLSEARERVALSLGASPDDLVFTSSGTEANQTAIRAVLENAGPSAHWITTLVEHECNLRMQEWVRSRGGTVSLLPVDQDGAPITSELVKLFRAETALVSVIWVSNETGVITDIQSLAQQCKARGVPLHLDAAQAWGKIPFKLRELADQGVTHAAFAAHKIGGLSGTGVLYVKPGMPWVAQIKGKQERSRRGGTENVLGIAAAGVAARLIASSNSADVESLRDRLEALITQRIAGTFVNGKGAPRVGNTLSLCFEGVERDGMVAALDLEGFAVSSGSACSSGVVEPSHVLLAMGRSAGMASAAVRVSIPQGAEWEDLEKFVGALERVVARLRNRSSSEAYRAQSPTLSR